jgi:hypothetical protein
MIYVGYPGIGKTSTAKTESIIDLESSNFMIDGERDKNWAIVYAKIAIDLDKQGYNVFVSSHKDVREALKSLKVKFYCIFPCLELKSEWIYRLTDRFLYDNSEKNEKSLIRCITSYYEDISDLMQEENQIIIEKSQYNSYKLKELCQNIK